jgi:PAS domain S-box-containing protein
LGIILAAALSLLPLLFPPARVFTQTALPLEVYLPLHTLLEFFAVVVDFLVFVIVWYADGRERSGNMTWLGLALFAAGWFDFLHALSSAGMPDLFTPSGPEKAILFWLAARLATAIGLCLAAFVPPGRLLGKTQRRGLLLAVLLFTAAICYLVLGHQAGLPRTLIEGQGLTPFKIAFEWGLIVLFGLAAIRFWRVADPTSHPLSLAQAAVIFVLAELCFTLYGSVNYFYNILGHTYIIFADFLIFRTVFKATVRTPYCVLRDRERELADANEQLRRIFDTAAVGMAEIDPASGLYTRTNAKFARMFGYERDELRGKGWRDLTWPEDAEFNLKAVQKLLSGERAEVIREKRYRHKQGYDVWALVHLNVLRDGQGGPLKVLNIVVDLSDLRRAEMERLEVERQLFQAQKMEAMGQLVGGIVHDFNNTLAVILGFTRLALGRHAADLTGKIGSYLHRINNAAERARELIAKLLAFSRSQPGIPGEIPPLPCTQPVKEAVKLLATTIPGGIRLDLRIADVPCCRIDPVELYQLVTNLVLNARDAIGDHGCIAIGLAMVTIDNGFCAGCRENFSGEFISLTVGDSGPGIGPELRARIFEPFFSTKAYGKGSGLGLSVVRSIAHHAGGHVTLESAPGQGAVFQVLLPPVEEAAPREEAVPPFASILATESREHSTYRILVVDDDDSVRYYLVELLTGQGYTVIDHRDAISALNDFRAHPDTFNLLVSDQDLPGLYGLELVRAVLTERPALPVILVTGNPDFVEPEELRRLGIRRLFGKPFDGADFLKAVAAALDGSPAGEAPVRARVDGGVVGTAWNK